MGKTCYAVVVVMQHAIRESQAPTLEAAAAHARTTLTREGTDGDTATVERVSGAARVVVGRYEVKGGVVRKVARE